MSTKNRKRNTNRKSYGRDRDRRDERASEQSGTFDPKGRNDLSWYTHNPNLLAAAGNFPFPYRPGMTLPLGTVKATFGGKERSAQVGTKIPGVMALSWMPSIGKSTQATDPASILGQEMYARIRAAYSGSSLNADAPDLVMYVMALDSIFSYIAWLKRIYRLLSVWTPDNYVLPNVVLQAMDLTNNSIQSLRSEKTRLWQLINELVLMSRKYTCPAGMDIISRHYWMSDNVYTDESTINSQFYLFNLRALYQFANLPMPNGDEAAGLQMVSMPTWKYTTSLNSQDVTVDSLFEFGQNLIHALDAWDDAYQINGYLRKAYENYPMFMVDEIPQLQPFTPVYEPEVLMQIENSRGVPYGQFIGDLSQMNITQDVMTNAVLCTPGYTVKFGTNKDYEPYNVFTLNQTALPPILSVRSDAPTAAQNVIASRLQSVVLSSDVTVVNKNVTIKCDVQVGTEFPMVWKIFGGNDSGSAYLQQATDITDSTDTFGDRHIAGATWGQFMEVDQFDWHPFAFITYALMGGDSETGLTPYFIRGSVSVFGDTHNITVIAPEDLANLHKVCIYSELNAFQN